MDITFYRDDLRVFIPVVTGLISFMIFWFTQKSETVKQKFFDKYGPEKGSARFILCTRVLGGCLMGGLPALVFIIAFPETTPSQLGVSINKDTFFISLLWSVGLGALLVFVAGFSAKKAKNLVNYPQIRTRMWNRNLVAANLFAWFIYLLGYEILFRGVLLFPLAEQIGLWPAIAINIGLYSATHIAKGLDETLGAIPLSIVLCLLTTYTGMIWVAFIVHVAMAWANSLVALKHQPEMRIV